MAAPDNHERISEAVLKQKGLHRLREFRLNSDICAVHFLAAAVSKEVVLR